MNLSFLILRDFYFPEINIRAHDENDIWRRLKLSRVYYQEKSISAAGCYKVNEKGHQSITINNTLTGLEKLRTQFHECIHSCLNYPIPHEVLKMYRSFGVIEARHDIIAEILSLILMFPYPKLEKYILIGEIESEYLPYVEERLQILNDYGI